MTIRAWLVLPTEGPPAPFGAGSQWRWPIFPSRREAHDWRRVDPSQRGRIVRCHVTYRKAEDRPVQTR